jgi:hypothetical protein
VIVLKQKNVRNEQIKEIANWLKNQDKENTAEVRFEINDDDEVLIIANKEGIYNLTAELLKQSILITDEKYTVDIEKVTIQEKADSFPWLNNKRIILREIETEKEPPAKTKWLNGLLIIIVVFVAILVVYLYLTHI